jgi:inorganic triphosphatase YgiF
MSPPREIELKLDVPIPSLPRLSRSSLFKGKAASARKPASRVSVYFDTKKLKLHNNSLSLRVRRIGSRRVQTIKKENGASAGLFDRNEWEHEIGAKQHDLDAAGDTALAPLVSNKLRRGLRPVFATRVHRKVVQIRSGDSEVELSIDRGKIEAGRKSSPLCELELELKQGDAADLFKLAKALAEEVPVQLAVRSKAERGYALLTTEKSAVVKATPIAIAPDNDVQSAFQAIAKACLYQLVANQPLMLDGDPDGLHQMRVSLRRLRAAISLFSDMLANMQTDGLKAELKWITGELGPARELDIFLRRVVKPAAEPHRPGVSVIGRELRQRLEDAVARARGAVESSRFRSLVLDTAGWIEAGDWTRDPDEVGCALRERPIADVAAGELRRRWKKIVKQGKRLDKLGPQRRHRLRIRTKKLRYATEFFAGVFPAKKSKRRRQKFAESLEKLQDSLGDLNDIAVHEELSERLAHTKGGSRRRRSDPAKKAFAAGRLSGREEARIAPVLEDAQRAYAAFAKAKPFWA